MPTLDDLLQETEPNALSQIGQPKRSLDDLMIEAKAMGVSQPSDNISAMSQELATQGRLPQKESTGLVERTAKSFVRKSVIDPLRAVYKKSKVFGGSGIIIEAQKIADEIEKETGRPITGEEYAEALKLGKAVYYENIDKMLSKTDVPPAKTMPEKGVEVGTGLGAFLTQLAATKKVLGPGGTARDVMAWEMLNEVEGGMPGKGALMRLAFAGIDKIPAKSAIGKAGKVGATSATLAGATAAAGGSKEDILVAALVPIALKAISATTQKAQKFTRQALENRTIKSMRSIAIDNGYDLSKVPNEALSEIVKTAKTGNWWAKQHKKGKISDATFDKRIVELQDRIKPIINAIAKEQPEVDVMSRYGQRVEERKAVGGPTTGADVKAMVAQGKMELDKALKPPPTVAPERPRMAQVERKAAAGAEAAEKGEIANNVWAKKDGSSILPDKASIDDLIYTLDKTKGKTWLKPIENAAILELEKRGKSVPAEVLAEYPDLAKQGKAAEEIWTSEIEKTKKGWHWFIYEKGKQVASDIVPTKKIAQQEIDGLIKYYKSTTRGKELLAKQAQPPAIAEGKKIKGRKKPRRGLADIAFVGKAYRGIMSIIEPAKLAQAKVGKEPVAAVMRGTFGKRERARVEFEQSQLDEMDETFSRLERELSKYTNEDLENIMLSRGQAESDNARKIQNRARAALPMELKTPEYHRALKEIADYNYKKLQKVAGDDINKVRDYFYGIYKEPKKVAAFLKYWKTTKRFTKEKVFPTYADAKAYGLEIRNPNPVTNLKSEYTAIAQLEAMTWLRDELMRTGEGQYIDLAENAPYNYVIIGEGTRPEPTFADVRVEPALGKLINNLISTNKITRYPALNTLRKINNFLRTIKFIGSAFHLKNIAKQSLADSGYFGVYKKTAAKGLTGGFRKDDPIFKTPEYLDYIENGGGHRYSVESEARRAFSDAIKKLTKSERAILKAGGLPFKIPVGFVDWMFESYIPKVKYAKYLDFVAEREKKLGRTLKPSEKQEIIKEQQNFYGMMNERLFGRSGTVTTALRFWFMAPGYGEGNYRTILKSALQWGGKEGYKASRSRSNIVNSLLVSGIAATIGTLIMTGKPPKKPETIEETRDLFKMDTGKKDKRGNPIMIDMLSYDKDYWNIYFNVLRGRPDIAADATIKRIGGMKAPTAQMAVDLALMAQGKAIYDFKEDKVYHLTDPFLQKVIKTTIHELERTIPISASVFKRAKQKEIDEVLSAVAALTGTQLTTGEKQKEEFKIVQDLWDMGEKREKLSYTLDKYEDPWKAVEQYNNTLKKIIDSKFITPELKKKAESKLIDPKKVINWKRFPPKQMTTSQLWLRFRSMTYKKDQDETRNFMKWRIHKGYEEAGEATRNEILRRQKGHK